MTSLNPVHDIHRYSDQELASLYPSHLKLILVQSIFRHGERAPVRVRLGNAGIPRHFDLCHHVGKFQSAVRLSSSTEQSWGTLRYERVVEEMDSSGKPQLAERYSGTCLLGELTDKGRRTTYHLGERLRELYVERLGFARNLNEENIYLRSSPMPRALESLQQVFSGMFPISTLPRDFTPVIRQRNFTDENLFPNEGMCKKLALLCQEFAAKAADEWNPILAGRTTEILGKYVEKPVKIDGNPRLTGLMDTINATRGNDLPLLPELQDVELLETMEKAAVAEWYSGYLSNMTYRRLGAGRLIGDLRDQIVASTKGDPLKIALYGAHDTTLGALLGSIGAFDNRWPPFTSHVAIETFEQTAGGVLGFLGRKAHLVRVRYNDRVVPIPACEDPTLCTLKEFVALANSLVPTDWQSECAI